MAELTLTGATLTSDGPQQHAVEMTSQQPHLSPNNNDALAELSHNAHHSHSHAHSHNNKTSNDSPCCSSPTPVSLHPAIASVPVEQVLTWEPSLIYKRLSDIVRMGSYDDFEPIVLGLIETQKQQQQQGNQASSLLSRNVLDMVGDDGPSLLHWAAKRVDDKRFLTTLCQHASTSTINTPSNDNVGMYPIHWACTVGSVPHLAALLKYGALLECTDQSGCTPLLLAAQYGHVDLCAFLLQKGANETAVDHSWDTALHWAAYKGSIQVCGLLLFRGALTWTMTDKYGQTPLHLASLRGHTTVVRYLLQYGTKREQQHVLFLRDENGNTPLDLAINRKRPNVQAVLRDAMESVDQQPNVFRQVKSGLKQLCSFHAWQVWMGIHGMNDEVDESPRFPFYFMLFHVLVATLWYPLVFLPLMDTSKGVLWDLMGWNLMNLLCLAVLWFCIYKVYTTNPGTLDEYHPKTAELRRIYEQTLESYSDEESFAKHKTPLCHTCHIAKPLRSKHCRVARRCVLLFDHHCPFVGNTIGLNNYRWFYLTLLSMTLAVIGFLITLGIYLHRQPKLEWGMLAGGIYMGLFIIPAGGMCIYHTQLMLANLTTNEHQNVARYKYLFNEEGQYKNLFFRGYLHNFMDRLSPSEASYTLAHMADQEIDPIVRIHTSDDAV